ncbi:MAG TPA: carboxypeptidase regulatory-like domain-containing protein [Vicinamibacterales bacterium]|nr:carboxypeptidase regulatory-like domain-containing protein [Vicinamibacterales bacterium]
MRTSLKCASVALALLVAAAGPAWAQQTTGTITGRVVDEQAAALPGATVTARHTESGFSRTVVTDGEGVYRLAALPVGTYDLLIEMSGFARLDRKGIVLNVGQTLDVNIELRVAAIEETLTVSGESPLIEVTSSSVGGVVDVSKIENLPLNGRQFANLAMTIPGVGLSFHTDPTKSTQYSPQIAGGNGRNVNYQIDGGDNNDDTVGGLLQLFPLEAIQEFNFVTQRYKAEYGRSNGGVMNIVTKSGTNDMKGSWFTNFRDKAMNAITTREKIDEIEKQDYRRYQFGGSFGGPISQNKAHFFAAFERTQQDTSQSVTTFGMFPDQEGVQPTPMRENLFTGKVSWNMTPSQYLAVRYGRNTNSQVYGVDARSVPDNWGDSTNEFNSINLNHNWVLGGTKLNEFIFQYADFANHITARSNNPQETFPNRVVIGYNSNTPQTTEQHKYQFRDDFSWHVTGKGGVGHDFKVGVNFINEPHLYITFNAGSGAYSYTHLTNDLNGPISAIGLGSAGAGVNLPMKQVGTYIQDDWRLTDRLTVNAGLRYDFVTGFAIDQDGITNFDILQAAGRAGYFAGVPGFEDWGKSPKEDYNNIQPRIGFAYDVRGDGRDVVRAGWGIYYDFGYTNANILFAGLNMVGGQGSVYTLTGYTQGIRNKDGTLFKVGDPISGIAHPNEADPDGPYYNSHVASPRILQPYTNQWSAGWSHQLDAATVLDVDYVGIRGHDLGVRWALNTRVNGGARRFADLGLAPVNPTFDLSVGASKFDGISFGVRRRMQNHVQFNAWYALSRARGLGGLGLDELTTYLVQDATQPFADVQWGPSARTDARHKVTISAVIELPGGFYASPIFRYRSALPLNIRTGYDVNADGQNNDIYTTAYKITDVNSDGTWSYEEMGPCETINCGRGAPLSQLNLRVSKVFKLSNRVNLEAIAEVFNLFNAINPNIGTGSAFFTGTASNHTPNALFMEPAAYAGESGEPEQRVGQIGFRFTF